MTDDPQTEASPARLRELHADAEYASWRARLYREKPYGSRIRPARRLRDLEQAADRAEAALAAGEADRTRS